MKTVTKSNSRIKNTGLYQEKLGTTTKFSVNFFPLFFEKNNELSDMVPAEKTELKIIGSNFNKVISDLDNLIKGGQADDYKFAGLRVVLELNATHSISVRVQTLGNNGLFALAASDMNIQVPTSVFNGKEVKDFRGLYQNKEFMDTLMSRLERFMEVVKSGNVYAILSKDVDSRKWNIAKGQYFSRPFETPGVLKARETI